VFKFILCKLVVTNIHIKTAYLFDHYLVLTIHKINTVKNIYTRQNLVLGSALPLILISLYPTIFPTSPAPVSCTSMTSATSDPCSKTASIVHFKIDYCNSFFPILTPPKFSICSLSKTQLHGLSPEPQASSYHSSP